jgi:hypothetical protein
MGEILQIQWINVALSATLTRHYMQQNAENFPRRIARELRAMQFGLWIYAPHRSAYLQFCTIVTDQEKFEK